MPPLVRQFDGYVKFGDLFIYLFIYLFIFFGAGVFDKKKWGGFEKCQNKKYIEVLNAVFEVEN